jgi:DNA-binding response OmpR family regulator
MRVLIVEDEVLIAALLEDMLAELGHESIGPAGTVETALAMIAGFELGAAVVDLNLKGVRAYPVANVLRQRGIPFIFTTGYASEELPKEWQDIRALQKPFSAPQLGSALKAIIGQ